LLQYRQFYIANRPGNIAKGVAAGIAILLGVGQGANAHAI
jgi:hypothetical protein